MDAATQVRHAEAAGAAAVVLINDQDEPWPLRHQDDVGVPVVTVRKSGGEVILARLPTSVTIIVD